MTKGELIQAIRKEISAQHLAASYLERRLEAIIARCESEDLQDIADDDPRLLKSVDLAIVDALRPGCADGMFRIGQEYRGELRGGL